MTAGARFVVSPGLSAPVVDRCRSAGVTALPGVATASDLMAATALGLTEVKFFPAAQLGGPAAIRALAAPFRHAAMFLPPSGGVNPGTMADYLAVPAVRAVSGSWSRPGPGARTPMDRRHRPLRRRDLRRNEPVR